MRTKNFLKLIVAAALCAVVSSGAFAQVTTSGAASVNKGTPHAYTLPSAVVPNVVDYVTIGSVMPYNVTPDPVIATVVASGAPFLPSSFNWRLGTTPLGTLDRANGSTALSTTDLPISANDPNAPYGGTIYTLDNAITVAWGATLGIDSIKVSEHSRNSAGIQTCDGQDSTIYVYVMPKPTATFIEAGTLSGVTNIVGTAGDATVGGCGVAGTTIHFNVTFTGTENYTLTYQYVYTPFGGGPSTVTPPAVTGIGVDHFYSATPASPNTEALTNVFTFAIPAATYGKYVFTLLGVTDLVSRKSLSLPSQDLGILNNTTGAAAPTLTLLSLPTPTTGTIKHVTNLSW